MSKTATYYKDSFSEEFERINNIIQGMRTCKKLTTEQIANIGLDIALEVLKESGYIYSKSPQLTGFGTDGSESFNNLLKELKEFSSANPESAADVDNGLGCLVDILPAVVAQIQIISDLSGVDASHHSFLLACKENSFRLLCEIIETQVFILDEVDSIPTLGSTTNGEVTN